MQVYIFQSYALKSLTYDKVLNQTISVANCVIQLFHSPPHLSRFLQARLSWLSELRRRLRPIEGILALRNMSFGCLLCEFSHAIWTRNSVIESRSCLCHLLLYLVYSSLGLCPFLPTVCILCCFHGPCHLHGLLEFFVLCSPLVRLWAFSHHTLTPLLLLLYLLSYLLSHRQF